MQKYTINLILLDLMDLSPWMSRVSPIPAHARLAGQSRSTPLSSNYDSVFKDQDHYSTCSGPSLKAAKNSSQLMQQSTFSESLALLRTRRFGTFFFASILSNIGTWTQQVAEPWLLLSLGASAFLVGLDTIRNKRAGVVLNSGRRCAGGPRRPSPRDCDVPVGPDVVSNSSGCVFIDANGPAVDGDRSFAGCGYHGCSFHAVISIHPAIHSRSQTDSSGPCTEFDSI